MDEPARQEGKRALAVAEGVIRMVVRAFYDDEVVVVMDGLLMLTDARRNTVSSMREQDLATELKLQHTFVRRCLAQLEKDCLVRSREVKETHGNREQNHQYWWVDHKQALDAIKLRMRRMRKKLEQEPAERKTEYVCETCVDDEDRHPSWDESPSNARTASRISRKRCRAWTTAGAAVPSANAWSSSCAPSTTRSAKRRR